MSTSNLSVEPELVVQSRKAAYCTRRRLDSPHLTTQDMEYMVQAAALVYWKKHREGRPPAFCFVCTRNAAERAHQCQHFSADGHHRGHDPEPRTASSPPNPPLAGNTAATRGTVC